MIQILYIVACCAVLPCIILGIVAQIKVNGAFNKYSAYKPQNNISMIDSAKKMLAQAGLNDVQVGTVKGHLTDNYNPKTKVISLSDSTRGNDSIASLGVIAHEIGHAEQQKDRYLPFRIRQFIVPIAQIGTFMFIPLVIIGVILLAIDAYVGLGTTLIWISAGFYFLSTLFYLVTLPVESNASKRALKLLNDSGLLGEDEDYMVKKVLNAACLTYVATLLSSLLNFLFFLLRILMIFRKK